MVLWLKTDFDELLKKIFALSPQRDEYSKRSIFEIDVEPQKIEYIVPERGILLFVESLYFFEPLLQSLTFEEFYQVFLCMLLEKTIVFVSTRIQKICSSM